MSNKLEQLGFKLEKILGFRNMQEKNIVGCGNYTDVLASLCQVATGLFFSYGLFYC